MAELSTSEIIASLTETVDRLSRVIETLTSRPSPTGSVSRGHGGVREANPPQRPASPGPRPQQEKKRTKYSWSQGGKPPAYDEADNVASDGQRKRCWAIAKTKGLHLPDAVDAFWRAFTIDELTWKQTSYLADAMEDGWTPAPAPEPEPNDYGYDQEPF